MENYQVGIILTLQCLSVMVLLVPFAIYCIRRVVNKSPNGIYKKTTVSRMLLFSACLIMAVWCLRYAVGYFSILSAESTTVTLTWWEEIFNSMLHALQTFSMDEDYTEYILNGKQMIQAIFGNGTAWETIYSLYASVLNFVAPVASGAIIFEILASVFPKIKLQLSYFAFWKEKYFFSELNAASLALAKSLYHFNTSSLKRPVLIITDAYVDDENEKSSETLLEAKLLGAICVRDDIAHVKKNRFGMRRFFLIDEVESGNLQTLAVLANSGNSKYLKNAEIYLFTNDDAYVQVEKSVSNQLANEGNKPKNESNKRKKKSSKLENESDKVENKEDNESSELPIFVPVQSYRNLISNLLVDIPLYEPLVGKERDGNGLQTLTVTILGTGHIGTEMFLTTYWIGQILDCKLKINVLSQESEEEFWSKIDYVNPEIKHTTKPGDPLLQINNNGDFSDAYCDVSYRSCEMKSSEFIACLTDPERGILDTDYFLVALGSDADNISLANTVRKYIGQYHINRNEPIHTVITYVVYDSELSDILNQQKLFKSDNKTSDVYMQAIGNLRDVYSVRNIFMADHEEAAQRIHDSYNAIQSRSGRAKMHRDRMADDYKHWADLARRMHFMYKVYSMGLIKQSLFDFSEEAADIEAYYKSREDAAAAFKSMVFEPIETKPQKAAEAHLELLNKMAWLEHRRWNAFTRVKGFRSTANYDVYASSQVKGSYKQMEIKLHPCLVECDQKGIKTKITERDKMKREEILVCENRSDFDWLDELSYDLYGKQFNGYDFKEYDYPICEG